MNRIIYFDVETDSLDFNTKNIDFNESSIIELAMLIVENDEIIEEYDNIINIGKSISKSTTDLTNITNEMISNGISESQVAKDLVDRLLPNTTMVAHNCNFDMTFIFKLLNKYYDALDIMSNCKWIDTLTILKDRKPYPHKLIDGCLYYMIDSINFHRAINDTIAMYKMVEMMKFECNNLHQYVNIFGYNPKYGINGIEFEFIKYLPQPYNAKLINR